MEYSVLNPSGGIPTGSSSSACSLHVDSSVSSSSVSHFSSGSGSGSVEEEQIDGGYDYEFISKIDEKYECPICCFVLRAPNQTKCGHRFCATCIKKWIREKTSLGRSASCPICSEVLSLNDLFSDNFAKREIMGLRVHCPHCKAGCEVVMDIRHVNKHLATCDYTELPCPNGCSWILVRMNLEDHLSRTCERRMTDCPVCHTPIRVQLQELHLEKDCPLVDLTCELCNAKIPRSQLTVHMKDVCPKVLVDCIYIKAGCTTKTERDQLDTHLHLSTQAHLRLLAEVVESIQRYLRCHQMRYDIPGYLGPMSEPYLHSLPLGVDSVSTADSGLGVTSTIHTLVGNSSRSFSTRSTESHTDLISTSALPQQLESLSLSIPTGYLDPTCLQPRQEREILRESTLRPHIVPQTLFQKLSFDVETERLTQTGSTTAGAGYGSRQQQQVDVETSSYSKELSQLLEKVREQANTIAQQTQKLNELLKHNRTLSDKVDIQQTKLHQLEDHFQDHALQNYSGTFIWKVENYSDKKMEAQRGSRTVIHSPGFYSSMYGYKLCVRLNLNGVESATGTHISLFVHFMQGEYDDLLDWPFSGRISLAILEQSSSTQFRQHITETLLSKPTLAAFQRPSTQRNHKGFGYVEFSPLSVIEGGCPCYRKNDAIYIKVKVDTN